MLKYLKMARHFRLISIRISLNSASFIPFILTEKLNRFSFSKVGRKYKIDKTRKQLEKTQRKKLEKVLRNFRKSKILKVKIPKSVKESSE